MIRRTLNSVLITVFLFSSVGYSISLHYCGNTLISVSIGSKVKSCCRNGTCTCCHNETKYYQLKDSYVSATQDINNQTKLVSDFMFVVADVAETGVNDFIHADVHFIAESPPPISLNKHLSRLQAYLL